MGSPPSSRPSRWSSISSRMTARTSATFIRESLLPLDLEPLNDGLRGRRRAPHDGYPRAPLLGALGSALGWASACRTGEHSWAASKPNTMRPIQVNRISRGRPSPQE